MTELKEMHPLVPNVVGFPAPNRYRKLLEDDGFGKKGVKTPVEDIHAKQVEEFSEFKEFKPLGIVAGIDNDWWLAWEKVI